MTNTTIQAQFRNTIKQILTTGQVASTRGLSYKYIFGANLTFNCNSYNLQGNPEIPIVDTHKTYWKVGLHEILWDLYSEGRLEDIAYKGLRDVWANFANQDGVVPNSYNYNWRKAFGYDQIEKVISQLKQAVLTGEASRSILLQSYNPAAQSGMPQCHPMVIFDGAAASNTGLVNALVVGR